MKFNQNIQIEGLCVGEGHAPFIVAEMSGNHNGSLDRAKKIIDAASEAGAHGIKLQTYTADTITMNSDKDDFLIQDSKSLWSGKRLYDLYDEAHTPWEWHEELFSYAKSKNILCFSTPFDFTAVEFLEKLKVPLYKIGSFENTHLPLIEAVAKTGKPVFISLGRANLEEIADVISIFEKTKNPNLVLVKCTSAYPAQPKDIHLKTLADIKKRFGCLVGLSDHTLGTAIPVAATALGACFIEKHFTLARADGGPDAAFSLEPNELKDLVSQTQTVFEALGSVIYGPNGEAEKQSGQFRQSIYFVKSLKAGEIIAKDHVRVMRPGYGLEPKLWSQVIGARVTKNVEPGDRTSKENIQFS